MSLSLRKEAILKIVVECYVAEATPVASKTMAENYKLRVSPATIRNDMAYLEEEGYITRPYHSAGSIPTDKAYRYYVETIIGNAKLSLAEQYLVYQLLQETVGEFEQWLKLAATLLAHFVHNIAVVTTPKTPRCRFKHLDLVALQDFIALLILVLHEARVRQQILSFRKAVTQEDMTNLANKLNATYAGMTSAEIAANRWGLSAEEEQVNKCVIDMMDREDKLTIGKPYVEGLRLMLSQPEFTRNTATAINILELLEEENWIGNIFYPESSRERVKIIIGEENQEEALRDFGLVIGRYGSPTEMGVIAVLGPKRMNYGRAISSVDYLSSLLSQSITEYI